jgi:D-glycero-alpha-D-manno-heptose-7-phosphate kinase
MLVTKTPLRVSFFGGGSDLPAYYQQKPGLCVSTTINSFIYLAVNKCVAKHLKVIYAELEQVYDVEDIHHSRVREALKYFEIPSNIEICSFSDIPTKGTGLGSSSSYTVGLVNALYYIKHGHPIASKSELASMSCFVEIDRCLEPIGMQDQYAATFGGFNAIRFYQNEIVVEPVKIHPFTARDLENHLLFFDTGISRQSSSILKTQQRDIRKGDSLNYISALVDMAEDSLKHLQNGHTNLKYFGHLLDDAWKIKKKLAKVSNDDIDEMYEFAIKAGAYGGKILGAGGGGYLMVFVPMAKKEAVIDAMKRYDRRDFKFFNHGSSLEIL